MQSDNVQLNNNNWVVMHQMPPTQAQQKNEQFRKQIRRRMIDDYMKSVRSKVIGKKFLKMEQTQNENQTSQNLTVQQLQNLINQAPTASNLSFINKAIFKLSQSLPQQTFVKLISYTKIHFLNKQLKALSEKSQFNDLIALLANVFALRNFEQTLKEQFDFNQLIEKLLFLIDQISQQSGSLIVWVLFQITLVCPQKSLIRIAGIQEHLKCKFGLEDIHLSYLFQHFAEQKRNLLKPEIVEEYSYFPFNPSINQQVYQNIILIFDSFLKENHSSSQLQGILGWICEQLTVLQFPSLLKTDLIYLLYNCIQNNLDVPTLAGFISQGSVINQLMQRSLYDTSYQNKTASIMCLNSLIKRSPKMQLQQLVSNYPTLIEVLTSSFYLQSLQIRVVSLASLAKIVISWPNNAQIQQMMVDNGLKTQLEILSQSQNQKISELARALIEDYLAY